MVPSAGNLRQEIRWQMVEFVWFMMGALFGITALCLVAIGDDDE